MIRPLQFRAVKHGKRQGDGGAAVAEFLMVSVLLFALLFAVVQVAVYLHVRNVVAASAAEGARRAAGADVVDVQIGCQVSRSIIAASLSATAADRLACDARYVPGDGGTTLVAVSLSGSVPLIFSWLGSAPRLDVTARALKEP